MDVGEDTPQETVVVHIGSGLRHQLHGVVPGKLRGSAQIVAAVRFVRTVEGALLHGTGHGGGTQVGTGNTVGFDEVTTQVGPHREPFVHFGAQVHLQVALLDVVGLDHTFFRAVGSADVVFGLLVAAGEGSVDIMENTGTDNQAQPVRIRKSFIGIHHVCHITGIAERIAHLGVVVIHTGVVHIHPGCGIRVFNTVLAREGVHTHVIGNLGFRLSVTSALGGDEDDAVGGAGAIDGGRCGILQHFDGLDVRQVQHGQRAQVFTVTVQRTGVVVQRNAVHHVQRFVAGFQGGRSADAHTLRGAQVTGLRGNRHTGHAALQHFRRAQRLAQIVVVGFELGDGVGDQFPALGAVTHHHHFIQEGGLLLQNDVEGSHVRRAGNDLGGIAQQGNHQVVGRSLTLDGEGSFEIGDGIDLRSLHLDGGPDERGSGRILHDAA